MDKEIRLSPRELLYISSLLDASVFIGVSDAFYGMDENEIRSEIQTLQTLLTNKGYAAMDFDGRFTLNPDISDTVNCCADCDAFVVVDKNKTNKPQLREIFYARDGRIIKMKEDIGVYTLTPLTDVAALLDHILRDIEWLPPPTQPIKRMRIARTVLSAAAEQPDALRDAEGLNSLTDAGCDAVSAKAILDGLTGKSNYYAVVVTVFNGDRKGTYSATLSDSDNGLYSMTPVTENDESFVVFEPMTVQQAKSMLADVVGHVSTQKKGV